MANYLCAGSLGWRNDFLFKPVRRQLPMPRLKVIGRPMNRPPFRRARGGPTFAPRVDWLLRPSPACSENNMFSTLGSRRVRLLVGLLAGWLLLAFPEYTASNVHHRGTASRPRGGRAVFPVQIQVDGKLDEPCYQSPPTVEKFVVACQPGKQPPKTKAWLFWQRERLTFAFQCEDADIVAAAPSANKRDVDRQDRCELFLWSGRPTDAYSCLGIAAGGAVARLFGAVLSPLRRCLVGAGLEIRGREDAERIQRRRDDYAGGDGADGLSPRTGRPAGGSDCSAQDFASHNPKDAPTWITWVDEVRPQADFHVAKSFGSAVLGPATSR